MKQLKKQMETLMNRAQKENPNANWRNLVTGVVILVLVGLFSVWYFSSAPQNDVLNNLGTGDIDVEVTQNGDGSMEGDSMNGENPVNMEGMVEVLEGEGLWQVAERVCGDGEKYVYLAEENGFSVWWAPIAPGDMLKVNCGTK